MRPQALRSELLQAKNVRSAMMIKGLLLNEKWVDADHPAIALLNDVRAKYISIHGLETYLSQMLGQRVAQRPMRDITLYKETGELLQLRLGSALNQPAQRFICDRLSARLPFKVYSKRRNEARYL